MKFLIIVLISAKLFNFLDIFLVARIMGFKGETALSINNTLRNERDQMNFAFKFFEVNDIIPTPSQVTDKYKEKQ